MEKLTAKSLEEFINIINRVSNSESMVWYRGQPNADYQLTPNILRQKRQIKPNGEDEKIIQKYTKEVEFITPSFEKSSF